MKRNIANLVFVQIITFVFVPVIIFKNIHHKTSIRAHIESIIFEIVFHETVFHAIGIEFYAPTVIRKLIVVKVNFRSAIHKNGSGVVIENIVFDFTEGKVFEQKSINAISPVIEEFIFVHAYISAVHYSNSSVIILKNISGVDIVMSEHKVQPITFIFFGNISKNKGVVGFF